MASGESYHVDGYSSSGSTVLDFQNTMQTFRVMFPDLDDMVIEEVLRSHGGSVDETVESLLKLSEAADSSSNSHGVQRATTAKVNDSRLFNDDISPVTSRWKPAMLRPLPADFLRPSFLSSSPDILSNSGASKLLNGIDADLLSRKLRENEELRAGGIEDSELVAYLEDERIAIMLQNREFVDMLTQDSDFMETFRNDNQNRPSLVNHGARPATSPEFHESRLDELNRPELGAFPYTASLTPGIEPIGGAVATGSSSTKYKLGPYSAKEMGKSTKVKLARLAKKFFTVRRTPGRNSLGGDALPNMVTGDESSKMASIGLLENDELAEESAFPSRQAKAWAS